MNVRRELSRELVTGGESAAFWGTGGHGDPRECGIGTYQPGATRLDAVDLKSCESTTHLATGFDSRAPCFLSY